MNKKNFLYIDFFFLSKYGWMFFFIFYSSLLLLKGGLGIQNMYIFCENFIDYIIFFLFNFPKSTESISVESSERTCIVNVIWFLYFIFHFVLYFHKFCCFFRCVNTVNYSREKKFFLFELIILPFLKREWNVVNVHLYD